MRYISIFLICLFILSGCENLGNIKPDSIANPTPVPSEEVKKENIKFEVTSFDLSYESDGEGVFRFETFKGSGIISAIGDQELVKKPYLVLVNVKKTSGGEKNSKEEGTRNVIVSNGIGKFSTSDFNGNKDNKMEKPVYEFNIIGYIPYMEISPK